MGDAAPALLTYRDYLDVEQHTGVKHEFHDGDVCAMAGGTRAHARLVLRVGSALDIALAGRECVAYGSELRVRIPERNKAYYADASVVCGAAESAPDDANAVVNPTVLVEVLSASTEAFDRGEKFDDYATLPSLKEYVLVSATRPLVEVYRRDGSGTWSSQRYGPGTTVELRATDVRFPVERLYEGVELDAPPLRRRIRIVEEGG